MTLTSQKLSLLTNRTRSGDVWLQGPEIYLTKKAIIDRLDANARPNIFNSFSYRPIVSDVLVKLNNILNFRDKYICIYRIMVFDVCRMILVHDLINCFIFKMRKNFMDHETPFFFWFMMTR